MLSLPTLLVRRSVAGVALVAMVAAGCGDDDDDGATTDTTEPMDETSGDEAAEDTATGDVLEVAAVEGDLTTFLAALEAAGTMDNLHGEGPFTVFAPTDAAFAAYLQQAGMSQDEVFANPTTLRQVLDFHIVNMSESADQVMAMAGQQLTTAGGEPLEVTAEGDDVMVGEAMVERYDIMATNGVIHVIDHVLIPPGM